MTHPTSALFVTLHCEQTHAGHVGGAHALCTQLTAGGHIAVTMGTREALARLDAYDVVVADLPATPDDADAEAVRHFVERGGGLLCLGATASAWARHPLLFPLIGATPSGTTRRTELIASVAQDCAITCRLDASFAVEDCCTLFEAAPADAQVLLRTTWQYTPVPLAYLRAAGEGGVVVCTLGSSEEALAHPALGQLLYRATRYLGGWREPQPARVAMIGYGAIGLEHGEALAHTPGLEYALVCDRSPARLEAAVSAFPTVRATTEMEVVAADPEIDVVLVCTPPNTHASVAERMLRAGKHVVVEKPFCISTTEADTLIALAEKQGLTLTVYQNRRWDPDFLAIRNVIRAGQIGEVFHVETFIGGYGHPCDFWHSHEPVSGGVFYDWGSHYLDWVLNLLPAPVETVRASQHKRVWHDVTNADQSNLLLRFTDGAEATFIHSDVAALLKPKWYVLGTRGAILGEWRYETVKSRKWSGDLVEEQLAPSEALPLVTVATRDRSGQMHHQQLDLPPRPLHPFHRNLADHLLSGEPLAVPPETSRRNIAVMEAAAYSAHHNAEVVAIAPKYA